MARTIDWEWLRSVSADDETRQWLERIRVWREQTLSRNEFVRVPDSFILRLGRLALRFHAPSSFSAVEIYEEIFGDEAHFHAPGFSGADAKTVVDVGANQGFYSLRLKEHNPCCRVIAVEPNPLEFAVLAENMQLNGLWDIVLEPVAIAGCQGTVRLEAIAQIGAITGRSVRMRERPWIKDEFVKILRVPAITLDDLLDKHNIGKVDILKIDVEGAEYEILAASRSLDRVSRIVLEYHDEECRRRLAELLLAQGFVLVLEESSTSNTYSGDVYYSRV